MIVRMVVYITVPIHHAVGVHQASVGARRGRTQGVYVHGCPVILR